jgi:hypothetical protein
VAQDGEQPARGQLQDPRHRSHHAGRGMVVSNQHSAGFQWTSVAVRMTTEFEYHVISKIYVGLSQVSLTYTSVCCRQAMHTRSVLHLFFIGTSRVRLFARGIATLAGCGDEQDYQDEHDAHDWQGGEWGELDEQDE